MSFLITFLEGLISFISPCMLPMLPVYLTYFAGGADRERRAPVRALCFVFGFTLVFCLMGLFAGTVGSFLLRYRTWVNIVCGVLVILFGLAYLEVIPLNFLRGMREGRAADSAVSAFLFGVVYSVSLTPCVGAFLGSALMMASASGTALQGILLLLAYSLGMGVPFLLSAVLLEKLAGAFAWIKRHYRVINIVCGVFLIVVGVCMALGLLNRLLSVFS